VRQNLEIEQAAMQNHSSVFGVAFFSKTRCKTLHSGWIDAILVNIYDGLDARITV
jgi:hypothetical protein